MKRTLIIAAGLSLMAAAAGAQNGGLSTPVCTSTGTAASNVAQDACQQAYDVYQFMAPQLGIALAGGNATLGQASTLGGLGHFSIGVRGNVFRGGIPDIAKYTQRTSGASPAQQLPTKDQILGLPTADVAIGIFGGLPLALTNVGGVDLIVSAAYVPTIGAPGDDFYLKPSQNLQLGYGARIGLLSESILVPGISVTYLKRDLPTSAITGKTTYTNATTGVTTATLNITEAKVNTTAWRLVASKSLMFLGLAGGVGQDKFDQGANVNATITSTLQGNPQSVTVNPKQSLTRTNYFLDASLNLILLKLTAEIGQSSGGTVNTFNTFSGGAPAQTRTYGSVGIRFGF